MADEPHDVVKLLVARMESNPEEFTADGSGRWAEWLDELMPFVTEAERVMLRKPMMQTIHEDVLDELLNGPDKRREAEENRKEYERHLAQAMQHTKMHQAAGQYQQAMDQLAGGIYGNGGGGGSGASLPVNTSPYSSGGGPSILPVANGGTGITGRSASSILMDEVYTGGITVPQPETTLSKSAIEQIKQALGIKK